MAPQSGSVTASEARRTATHFPCSHRPPPAECQLLPGFPVRKITMATSALELLLFACCVLPGLHSFALNQRPIVGILAQETFDPDLLPHGKYYIAAPYVKYLESAGCRVVPVRLNLTNDEYEKIFYSINGILFPGGSSDVKTSAFAKVAKTFYNFALKAFDAGDYFPIWGTCLGMQLLTVLTAGKNLLINTETENIALPLNLTYAAEFSEMFQQFPSDVYRALSQEPLTGNFHHFSLSVKDFLQDEELRKFYSILSTNYDRKGVEFVSTMEEILFIPPNVDQLCYALKTPKNHSYASSALYCQNKKNHQNTWVSDILSMGSSGIQRLIDFSGSSVLLSHILQMLLKSPISCLTFL
ncbi:gamma-glutamyl hydrolase-like isoform X2 [Stegostoma tigrinum]|uniref:gamma-glutamyl hydrolase-like isoform X2 n=1 Tax=Stegostoma tigrinum TaxID=3053191 RepID=UPI00202AE891|nr:gamma-glutamyl hydrolase-like isoform X2 [Stegostoma tigrinum]